jgi:two-component system LytT family response regulator
MLTCYIVDDEQNAIAALVAMLQKKFGGQISVCGSTTKASAAIEDIITLQPDIVFLDVEMPGMNGLQLLDQFPQRNFHVIFTTAHEKYALPALKATATDYLLKPLSPKDVYDALQKCVEKRLANPPAKALFSSKILLPAGHETLLINVQDIVRVEANDNYSHFYFTNRPKIIVSKTLKEFEAHLTAHQFYRIHQSHLINLQYVEAVQTAEGDFVLLRHGHKVEISRRKKAAFLQLFK